MIWLIIPVIIVGLMYVGVFWWLRNPIGTAASTSIDKISVSREKLREHVEFLADIEPPRNVDHLDSLERAAAYIEEQWKSYGFDVTNQHFTDDGKTFRNVVTAIGPSDAPRIVVGAHYDVCGNQPGADDNASAVAGLLELSYFLKQRESTLNHRFEFVAYTLEEPPYFATQLMGSAVHARSLSETGADVRLMISLEMLGFFSDEKGSQQYPFSAMSWWYPTVGNFIAVVGDQSSMGRKMTRRIRSGMQRGASLPVYSINAPSSLPGIDFSDHRNYWAEGFPAIMITDTAFFRNANYHQITDTPDTLEYSKMAQVIEGVYSALLEITAKQ